MGCVAVSCAWLARCVRFASPRASLSRGSCVRGLRPAGSPRSAPRTAAPSPVAQCVLRAVATRSSASAQKQACVAVAGEPAGQARSPGAAGGPAGAHGGEGARSRGGVGVTGEGLFSSRWKGFPGCHFGAKGSEAPAMGLSGPHSHSCQAERLSRAWNGSPLLCILANAVYGNVSGIIGEQTRHTPELLGSVCRSGCH